MNKLHCCPEFYVCLSIIIAFITTLRFLKVFDFTYAMAFPLNQVFRHRSIYLFSYQIFRDTSILSQGKQTFVMKFRELSTKIITNWYLEKKRRKKEREGEGGRKEGVKTSPINTSIWQRFSRGVIWIYSGCIKERKTLENIVIIYFSPYLCCYI